MKTALLIIATGSRYHQYAQNLMVSAKRFFVPHDVVLFTDRPVIIPGVVCIHYPYQGFPEASYRRYHAFVAAKHILSQYQQVFYCDADMKFVAPVTGDEVFSIGITATRHPGYIGRRGTPETRPESTACCPDIQTYFCGGFQGGAAPAYLTAAEKMAENIGIDDAHGIQAVWVDESHWNKYLHENPPAKILSPSYCYPDGYKGGWGWEPKDYAPKLLALNKE